MAWKLSMGLRKGWRRGPSIAPANCRVESYQGSLPAHGSNERRRPVQTLGSGNRPALLRDHPGLSVSSQTASQLTSVASGVNGGALRPVSPETTNGRSFAPNSVARLLLKRERLKPIPTRGSRWKVARVQQQGLGQSVRHPAVVTSGTGHDHVFDAALTTAGMGE